MAKPTNGSVTDTGAAGAAFAKMMSDFPFFSGFNYDAMLDGQRRNWAALMEANKLCAECAQELTARQMEFARQSMQNFASLVQEAINKPGSLDEQLGKTADYTRHTLDGFCELADRATKSSAEVMKLINQRMSESLDEARNIAKRMPQRPSSAHAAAAE
ncbi:MAG: TIGR01841 family phasin [Alphaproteobacteria bacterium]|nr:TIGR01841 family phasin [Alphaproteobacteria bacterium]